MDENQSNNILQKGMKIRLSDGLICEVVSNRKGMIDDKLENMTEVIMKGKDGITNIIIRNKDYPPVITNEDFMIGIAENSEKLKNFIVYSSDSSITVTITGIAVTISLNNEDAEYLYEISSLSIPSCEYNKIFCNTMLNLYLEHI